MKFFSDKFESKMVSDLSSIILAKKTDKDRFQSETTLSVIYIHTTHGFPTFPKRTMLRRVDMIDRVL